MKYLLFSGSLRTDSLNKKLIKVVHKILTEQPANEVATADIRSLSIPVYDGDIETAGIPEGVEKLGEMISNTHAVIISSPEYNSSIAGPLKNTIDWISRLRPIPFESKAILLLGASPGGFGAIRGLTATRAPLENLGSFVFPQVFALPKANEAFKSEGVLADTSTQKKLSETLFKFDQFANKLK